MEDRREAGFSLAELVVVVAILGFVMAAIVGIYLVTQRSTLVAGAAEDAQVLARAVLDQVASDLRLINSSRSTATGAITAATAASITFLGDIDSSTIIGGNEATLAATAGQGDTSVGVTSSAGFSVGDQLFVEDGPVYENQPIIGIAGNTLTLGGGLSTWYARGSIMRSVKTVTFTWDAATGTLCRNANGPCLAPFAPNLVIASGVMNFQLTYWSGASPPSQILALTTQATRDTVRQIRAQITTQSRVGDQTVRRAMAIAAKPRNLPSS